VLISVHVDDSPASRRHMTKLTSIRQSAVEPLYPVSRPHVQRFTAKGANQHREPRSSTPVALRLHRMLFPTYNVFTLTADIDGGLRSCWSSSHGCCRGPPTSIPQPGLQVTDKA
jgi:hypothetical protein